MTAEPSIAETMRFAFETIQTLKTSNDHTRVAAITSTIAASDLAHARAVRNAENALNTLTSHHQNIKREMVRDEQVQRLKASQDAREAQVAERTRMLQNMREKYNEILKQITQREKEIADYGRTSGDTIGDATMLKLGFFKTLGIELRDDRVRILGDGGVNDVAVDVEALNRDTVGFEQCNHVWDLLG